MRAIRELIRRYPIAAIAAVVAVAAFGGLALYQSQQAQSPAARVSPAPAPVATVPVTPAPGAVTPTAPAGPGGAASVVTPSGGAAPGAAPPQPAGDGRPNPFEPLAGPQGPSQAAPAGPSSLPPVPPLPPATPSSPATVPPVSPAAQYRIAGFVWSSTVLAILVDTLDPDQSSYIVAPGDTVKGKDRVVAIDVRREIVTLNRDGTVVDLTFAAPTVRRSP